VIILLKHLFRRLFPKTAKTPKTHLVIIQCCISARELYQSFTHHYIHDYAGENLTASSIATVERQAIELFINAYPVFARENVVAFPIFTCAFDRIYPEEELQALRK